MYADTAGTLVACIVACNRRRIGHGQCTIQINRTAFIACSIIGNRRISGHVESTTIIHIHTAGSTAGSVAGNGRISGHVKRAGAHIHACTIKSGVPGDAAIIFHSERITIKVHAAAIAKIPGVIVRDRRGAGHGKVSAFNHHAATNSIKATGCAIACDFPTGHIKRAGGINAAALDSTVSGNRAALHIEYRTVADCHAAAHVTAAASDLSGFIYAAVNQCQRTAVVNDDRAVVTTAGDSITSKVQRDIAGYRNITLDVLSQRSITVNLCNRRTLRRRIAGKSDSR